MDDEKKETTLEELKKWYEEGEEMTEEEVEKLREGIALKITGPFCCPGCERKRKSRRR